jgi:hypothetical protein
MKDHLLLIHNFQQLFNIRLIAEMMAEFIEDPH